MDGIKGGGRAEDVMLCYRIGFRIAHGHGRNNLFMVSCGGGRRRRSWCAVWTVGREVSLAGKNEFWREMQHNGGSLMVAWREESVCHVAFD